MKKSKKQILRNFEYYDIQDIFDNLYEDSRTNKKFNNLIPIIKSKENIMLAYRHIKTNKGSKTSGTDEENILDLAIKDSNEFIRIIQISIDNYKPKPVRRVEIPKPNGKLRPLGIPCIKDRIVQQCVKQVLEPICEAKFHRHSYGFRPNRSTHHAIARCQSLMNISKLHYVVDIDIKGFFDNVCHSKLLKQMWHLGIQDKNLLTIIKKMLTSEIKGIGIPTKGTPQGGVLSPLLSNIVLNELDWWLSSQWETFETKYDYRKYRDNRIDYSHKYRAMMGTKLKRFYFVRYADDFKILCNDYETARKIFIATENWLKERLGLEISKEKSKITNVRKGQTEFLGIKMKVTLKNKKYVCVSRMTTKSYNHAFKLLRKSFKNIDEPTVEDIRKINACILGLHNYYKVCSRINLDFDKLNFLLKRIMHNKFKHNARKTGKVDTTYNKLYGKYKGYKYHVNGMRIFPIYGVKCKPPLNFNQNICNYTVEGRELIHKKAEAIGKITKYLVINPSSGSIEYNDNRISLYVAQHGKCGVTGHILELGEMECHHKVPKAKGGTDKYDNLIWLTKDVHKLVHCKTSEKTQEYKERLNLTEYQNRKLNRLLKLL